MFEQTLKVEAYVYLVTDTALDELDRSNPLEPQKFKKRSGHRNVKRKQDEIKKNSTLHRHSHVGGNPCVYYFIL